MKHTIFHILEKSDWHKGYTGKTGNGFCGENITI